MPYMEPIISHPVQEVMSHAVYMELISHTVWGLVSQLCLVRS